MIRRYLPSETLWEHNKFVLKPINATVTEEANGMFELEIELPKGTELNKRDIITAPTPRGEQPFRVYRIVKTLYGIRVNAKHIFYDLADSLLLDARPTNQNAQGALQTIITASGLTGWTYFSDITKIGTAYYIRKNPVEAIMGADNCLLKVWGGNLLRNKKDIRVIASGIDRGYEIRLGKNLVGIEDDSDDSAVVTRLYPTYEKDNVIYDLPEKYIDSPLIGNYISPITKEERVSLTDAEKELPIAQIHDILRTYCQNLFTHDGVDKPVINYKVDFVELSKYKSEEFIQLEKIDLYDIVTVDVAELGIKLKARVIKYTYDAVGEKYSGVELGGFKPSNKYSTDNIIKQIEIDKENASDEFRELFNFVIDRVTGNKGGYQVTRVNANGEPYETLWMDTPKMSTAKNVLRINKEGIAGSVNGINGPYATAITTDGWIVAERIMAYSLDAISANLGTITAGRIQDKDNESYWDLNTKKIKLNVDELTVRSEKVVGESTYNKDKIEYSDTAPAKPHTGKLWIDTSITPNLLKRWNGTKWLIINDATELTNRVSTIEQTADDITVRFDTLSVGAHNLALRSNRFFSNYDYVTGEWELSEKIVTGEEYTVTVWGVLGTGKTNFSLYLNGGSNKQVDLKRISGGRFQATFIGKGDESPEDVIRIYSIPNTVTDVVSRITNIKLEKGNQGTPYSRSPVELYSGITRIDKDGINVSVSNSDLNTQIANDGLSVYSENNLHATFGGAGAQVPVLTTESITGDIVNVLAEDVTLTVGEDREFATITKALQYLGGDGKRTKFLNGKIITINVFGVIEDDVFIRGYQSGEINITFYTKARLNGRIYLEGNTTSITIQGSSTTSRGVISYSGITPTLIDVWACNYVRVQFMEFDRNGNASVNAVRFNNGSVGLVNDSDFGTCQYGINLYRASLVNAADNRGSNTTTSFFIEDSTLYQRGTKPTTGINSTRGHYVTSGTITDLASAFVAPGKKATTLKEKFYKTSMYTNLRGTSTRATSYGARAVQGRVSSMATAMDGYITFNREAYDFIQGGTNTTVKLWVYRTANAHGYSAPAIPTPDNFSASFGGAALGQWVSATISSSYLTSSGATFKFYSPNVNSGYAIFSNAYLEVTTTKTI